MLLCATPVILDMETYLTARIELTYTLEATEGIVALLSIETSECIPSSSVKECLIPLDVDKAEHELEMLPVNFPFLFRNGEGSFSSSSESDPADSFLKIATHSFPERKALSKCHL